MGNENIVVYIDIIQKELDAFFEEQKDFIHCKSGCSFCCENAQFPVTPLEFSYIAIKAINLPPKILDTLKTTADKIKADLQKWVSDGNDKKEFAYTCPFLLENENGKKICCIYSNRPIVCRTYGLCYHDKEGEIKIPHCVYKGLNYSSVYDTEKKQMSAGITAYNIRLKYMFDNETTRHLGLEFGEPKMLIEFFEYL